ncbi:NmrA family NAD(P)-binding protein [Nocardioides rubriscoriae]|uniref:NmrA family NAD(P)-binding protein n=1 Tax=Nocardioides rubriscoriae TaxID=642762 RepID=UPI0011DFB8CB|nr:NmrA family NAD(P)-binding protein [Nocardioides rubriscoriae]
MTHHTILVLGGTGKTARRLVPLLAAGGARPRTAARSGGDATFDWYDDRGHDAALEGVDAVYLVPPAGRLDHPPKVAAFLDRAERAGVRHVTMLSAYGVDLAPDDAALRAVELDLAARTGLTHSIVRPSWFMQNFTESFFAPSIAQDGVIVAPTGDGTEAFVSTADIAAVVAATLLDPAAHAGAAHDIAGPEALTLGQVAGVVSRHAGKEVSHVDLDRDVWVAQAQSAELPADYAEVLAGLFDLIRAGHGSRPGATVEEVTGRAPESFEAFAAREGAAWRAGAA